MNKSSPTPPPAPAPIDAGKSALDYTRSMADPELQNMLLANEKLYRPQYAALNLADMQTYMLGANGQKGALDFFDDATRRAGALQEETLRNQRASDITDVEKLGARATEAMRNADPYSTAIANQQQMLAQQLYGQTQGLSPEQMRLADQQARAASMSRGRIGDQSSVASEILGREGFLSQKRQEAQQAGQMAFGMNRAISADPFQAILGRSAGAMQFGMNQQQFVGNLGQQGIGPRFMDPNAGINLALKNQSNQSSYDASIFGSQAAMAGANAQGNGALMGGLLTGAGTLLGGPLGGMAGNALGSLFKPKPTG